MATVHLALDEKHRREVALKALRPDLSAVVGPDRFLREIEITARLNHPHILPLLDSGAEDGLLYYVAPYVAGGSLRRLLASGSIPLAVVTRVTRQVAAALDHAHSRGVLHRDVKPENILFNEGLAVVADFGIARALRGATESRMTGTGLSVGTLGYMSPEQALGSDDLDPRSDVYSLGCVVYEMLVGGTPASWPGPEDVELGRLSDLPPNHRRRLDAQHGRLEQVLVRALALRPEHRYGKAGELAAELTSAAEPTRRLADEEVGAVLGRAAELQAAEPEDGAEGALTMGAVEQIAAQVGIPPAHVRDAARELSVRPPSTVAPGGERGRGGVGSGRRWNRLAVDRRMPVEVPEAAYPAMVAEIQRRLDTVGHASVIDGGLTWSPAAHAETTRRVVVRVTPGEGETEIRIREDLELVGNRKFAPPVGGLSGVLIGGALAASIGAGEPAGPLLVILLAVMGVVAAIYTVTRFDADEREPELGGLASALVEIGTKAAEE
jgi:hypothetical protein